MIWSKIFFEKNVFFYPKFGLFAFKMGPNGGSIGGYKGPILGFWGSQTMWEPIKNDLEQNFFREKRVFWPQNRPFCTHTMAKMGIKNGQKRIFWENFLGSKSFYFGSHMVWDPQKPKIGLPMDPQWTPFGPILCAKGPNLGVKKRVFLKNVFSYKTPFLGGSDHFSLGSKWFWYLQNDKMYTWGPTERPNGVRKGPRVQKRQ